MTPYEMRIIYTEYAQHERESREPVKGMTTELLKADVMIGLDAFRDLIEATYRNNHGSEPIDRFLCYPDKAMGFAHTIRSVLDAPKLPDHVVLMTLIYLRKQGRVKAGAR